MTSPVVFALSLGASVIPEAADPIWRLLPTVLAFRTLVPLLGTDPADTNRGTAIHFREPSTTYALGAKRCYGNGATCRVYVVTTPGTTAASVDAGPTGTTTATDGGVVWTYVSACTTARQPSTVYAAGSFATNIVAGQPGRLFYTQAGGTTDAGTGPASATPGLDGSVTWVNVVNLWVDSAGSGNGTTLAQAQAALPASPAPMTKLWVAAGSTFSIDVAVVSPAITLPVAVTSYDRATGNEIIDHDDPYVEAMALRWPTPAKKQAKYWRLSGNAPSVSVPVGKGVGAYILNDNKGSIFRGAWITGFAYAGFLARGVGGKVVEDCVFEDNWTPQVNSVVYPGCSFKSESASTGDILRRCFIAGKGVDATWWGGSGTDATNWRIVDCAIQHSPTARYEEQHCDAVQAAGYLNGAKIVRSVVEHYMPLGGMVDGAGIGAAVIAFGGDTNPDGFEIVGSVIVSNLLVTNTQRECKLTRTLAATVRGSKASPAGPGYVHVHNQASDPITDSASVLINAISGDIVEPPSNPPVRVNSTTNVVTA